MKAIYKAMFKFDKKIEEINVEFYCLTLMMSKLLNRHIIIHRRFHEESVDKKS